MNSSLLVPAFVGVSLAAVFGVFFSDSIFPGDSKSDGARSVAVNQVAEGQSKVVESVTVATSAKSNDSASDFTWAFGDSKPATSNSAAQKYAGEDAPGAPSISGSKSSDVKAVAAKATVSTGFNTKAAESQISRDLGGFFNKPKAKTNSPDGDLVRSAVRKTTKKETSFIGVDEKNSFDGSDSLFTQANPAPVKIEATKPAVKTARTLDVASDSSFGSQVAVTSPKNSSGTQKSNFDLDAFGASDNDASSSFNKTTKAAPKSVVMAKPISSVQRDASADSSVFSGDLTVETGSSSSVDANTLARKFKITNPKETTLPVTLSIDGEQITLKPDQSYVFTNSGGKVDVTFSRGGSFGFEKQTLNTGHYRFSVNRRSGWKLSN